MVEDGLSGRCERVQRSKRAAAFSRRFVRPCRVKASVSHVHVTLQCVYECSQGGGCSAKALAEMLLSPPSSDVTKVSTVCLAVVAW